MWMFLLACSRLDALTAPEPVRGPIPSTVSVDGVQEAVVVERRVDPPAWEALGTARELVDDHQPPYVADLRALVLSEPEHPWLEELLRRPLPEDELAPRHVLDTLLQDEPTCQVALDHVDAWGLPVEVFDSCAWSLREAVLARFPEAAERDAWAAAPLPDDLAQAFSEGSWLPNVVVLNYPNETGRVRRAAARCVDDASDYDITRSCLLALSTLDWTEARTRRDRVFGSLNTALERFETGRDVEDWLDAQGFPPRPDDAPLEGGSLPERLRRRGALWEPTDPALFPLLLDQLGVEGVTLRFVPAVGRGRYETLYAYQDGVRLRVLLDPIYGADPEQLAGLANVLARRAGVNRRAMWVVDDSLGWRVITGPVAALRAVVDEGLLDVPEPVYREEVAPVAAPEVEPVDTGAVGFPF